jgi:GNAT superfamily N-acetyltransferase
MIERVLRTWADDAATFAVELARVDPSWRSETFELAGGRVVLCGRGMYVNRAMAVGLDGPLSDDDFEFLEARSDAVGVAPAVEVSPETHPAVHRQLAERGYRPDAETTALRRSVDPIERADDGWIVIRPANTDLLATWQSTSAKGWGHVDPAARRASDVFAGVAATVDGEGLVLATDASDGRPIGCASLTFRDGVATLGGMSTVPAERGRGVQAALIRYRLHYARSLGCEIVTSSTAAGSASEHNLIRHGFEPWFTITTLIGADDAR